MTTNGDPAPPAWPGSAAPPTFAGPMRTDIPENPGPTWFVGEGWRLLWSDWGLVAGAWLIAWLIGLAAGFLPVVGSLSGFFVAPLYVSAGFLAVRKWRGESPRVSEMFDLRDRYWPLVLQQLVITLLAVLAYVPAAILLVIVWFSATATGQGQGSIPPGVLTIAIVATVVVALLTLGGSIYLSVRLAFAGFLFMDAPKGTLDSMKALRKSWEVTRGPVWNLFGVGLLLMGTTFLTVLLLIIGGLLIGLPLAVATIAVCYGFICPKVDNWRYCGSCGYDMIHSPGGQCPECGALMQPPPLGPA